MKCQECETEKRATEFEMQSSGKRLLSCYSCRGVTKQKRPRGDPAPTKVSLNPWEHLCEDERPNWAGPNKNQFT